MVIIKTTILVCAGAKNAERTAQWASTEDGSPTSDCYHLGLSLLLKAIEAFGLLAQVYQP